MTQLPHRLISRWALGATLGLCALFVACDDGGNVGAADIETSVAPLEDGVTSELDATPSEASADAVEDAEADILYPGNTCGGDNQCSTGLCYGLATPQGAFEKPKCQSLCLGLNDFARYCDSDDDCCKGRCCIGCGEREGLCVLD